MELDENSVGSSGETLMRNGVPTSAGRAEESRESMEVDSLGSDVVLVASRPRTQRALPSVPADRFALEWNVTMQKHQGKHASCRACCTEFASNEVRFSRSSDSRAGSARYLHAACVPGGFHPQDTFAGTAATEQVAMDLVSSFRGTLEQVEEPLQQGEIPTLPAMSGEAWWSDMPWDAVFQITTDTLFDIPSSTQMAYALLKCDVVNQCLEAGMTAAASPLWKKLSFMDSLILNSRRENGETQAQSVVRRLQQASDGDWQSLWSEATLPKRRSSLVARPMLKPRQGL